MPTASPETPDSRRDRLASASAPEVFENNREQIEGMPAIFPRWIDMSAYGMALKLACDDDHRWLSLEGGDLNVDLALRLGFAREKHGWVINNLAVDTRKFMTVAPQSVLRPSVREAMLDTSRMTQQPVFKAVHGLTSATTEADLRAKLENRATIRDLYPEFSYWPDLSDYGMTVKVSCDDDDHWFTLDGGDADPELAARLGFTRADDEWTLSRNRVEDISNKGSFGYGMNLGCMFDRVAPEVTVKVRTLSREDILDTSRMSSPPAFRYAVPRYRPEEPSAPSPRA